jgi:release factor glutamine methyltransferase
MPTVADLLRRFPPSGSASPGDARALLAHVLGLRGPLSLQADARVSEAGQETYRRLLARREAGEPLQYVLGEWDFFGRTYRVDRRGLIPRPETEHLVEEALRAAPAARRIADLGCGSGVLAVTLALEFPESRVTATDVSVPALALARENARLLGVESRVRFLSSDWLSALARSPVFDLAVANPPYVSEADREELPPVVRDHEPANALFSGGDGLHDIRRLIESLPPLISEGGHFLFEFGFGQRPGVEEIVGRSPEWRLDRIVPDLAGIPRVAALRRSRARGRAPGGLAERHNG